MAVASNKSRKSWLKDRKKATGLQIKPDTKLKTASDEGQSNPSSGPLFENTFKIEDLQVFDDSTLCEMLDNGSFGLSLEDLAHSLQGADETLVRRIRSALPRSQRPGFFQELHRTISPSEIEAARQRVLDGLFWELTYWKTPELYEELTEGEYLHPGIFRQLGPDLKGKVALDAGAGSGRASFECLRKGAKLVYAVEPSPGLLNILEKKLEHQPAGRQIIPCRGRFDSLPLEDNSVDLAISCSAFTAEPEQGGEPGLRELQRVTRPGGKIVIIWPRPEDRAWFEKHGFKYVALPVREEMKVRFRSLRSAIRCARRFYHKNQAVLDYLLHRRRPEVPFSVLGFNPPRDYCWLEVQKSDE